MGVKIEPKKRARCAKGSQWCRNKMSNCVKQKYFSPWKAGNRLTEGEIFSSNTHET